MSIDPGMYCEPYAGDASVFFFALEKSTKRTDILNDTNRCLVAMYKAFKRYPNTLYRMIDETLYSHESYITAKDFISDCKTQDLDKDGLLKVAYNTYISLVMSVSNIMGSRSGWSISKSVRGNKAIEWQGVKTEFRDVLMRLETAYIECLSAEDCIKKWDGEDVLFYVDSPYPGCEYGHYGSRNRSYSVELFDQNSWVSLCDTLSTIKGDYILSNYDNDIEPDNYNFKVSVKCQKRLGVGSSTDIATEIIWIKTSDPDNISDVLSRFFHQIITVDRHP
jgi:DNA adenine methylase